jgi:hypothetical protein
MLIVSKSEPAAVSSRELSADHGDRCVRTCCTDDGGALGAPAGLARTRLDIIVYSACLVMLHCRDHGRTGDLGKVGPSVARATPLTLGVAGVAIDLNAAPGVRLHASPQADMMVSASGRARLLRLLAIGMSPKTSGLSAAQMPSHFQFDICCHALRR